MSNYDCIIVGSGINALVAAALLARKGNKVLILERNDRLGGCIRTEEITVPGFKHDVLSSWHPLFITSPGYAELREELERYGLEYCHTDQPTGVVLPDNRFFILRTSREDNIRAMNAESPGDGDAYRETMAELEQTLDLTFTLLGSELWTWRTAKVFLSALFRRGPRFLAQFFGYSMQTCRAWLQNTFRSNGIQACFAPWVLHAGVGPEAVSSGYMGRIITFTLEAAGCPVVKGGSYKLVEAFEQLIRAHGGELKTNADVDRIISRDGVACAVVTTDGTEYNANKAILCSMTPGQLYERLLTPADVPDPVKKQVKAFQHGNADMQIHLALDKPPRWCDPALGKVALLHLTAGIDAVSKAVNEAERGLLPECATIVVGQPAVLDPSRVPEGKGLIWIQLQELPRVIKGDAAGEISVPADGKWNEQIKEAYADRIIERLAQHIPDIKENIIRRTVLSPADLEAININLVGGDPYGGACSLDQFFLWRPLRALKNHETPLKNLYHIGASTHPGPGLGGGSGYLVATAIR